MQKEQQKIKQTQTETKQATKRDISAIEELDFKPQEQELLSIQEILDRYNPTFPFTVEGYVKGDYLISNVVGVLKDSDGVRLPCGCVEKVCANALQTKPTINIYKTKGTCECNTYWFGYMNVKRWIYNP